MRFHIPGLAHTVTESSQYSACAFTQKVFKLCGMLKSLGHHVIHYGHERSTVDCSEHVTVTNDEVLREAYGDYNWRKEFFKHDQNDHAFKVHAENTIKAIQHRKRPNDFLLLPFGWGHKRIADAHRDLICVESGIGYSDSFAQFKIFESYALMHAFHGTEFVREAKMGFYNSFVVPNHFDPEDFSFKLEREDWILYLGRMTQGKGLHIILDATRRAGRRLVVAGQGDFKEIPYTGSMDHVDYVGYADREKRRDLMSRCGALIILSQYIEPFGGVAVEAMMSGAPVVASDWGVFPETIRHGETGYRVRTMEDTVWALKNVGRISPTICRDWAVKNYSNERVGRMYNEVFRKILDIYDGSGGWYAERPERTDLEWLRKY
jgi:glycosyltransferase involved in cell wall biosynthesis